MTTTQANAPQAADKQARRILRTIAKKHFCTIATVSAAGRPHSAGVVYDAVDTTLWIHAMRTSRKARNVETNPHAGITIPFRRMPAGPPFTIHFQASATLVSLDDPSAQRLIEQGQLRSITGHGALEMPDACFIRVQPTGSVHSYGPGAKIIDLIRDPLNNGAGSFQLTDVGRAGGVLR